MIKFSVGKLQDVSTFRNPNYTHLGAGACEGKHCMKHSTRCGYLSKGAMAAFTSSISKSGRFWSDWSIRMIFWIYWGCLRNCSCWGSRKKGKRLINSLWKTFITSMFFATWELIQCGIPTWAPNLFWKEEETHILKRSIDKEILYCCISKLE